MAILRDDGAVVLRELSSGREIGSLPKRQYLEGAGRLAFSSDGTFLAVRGLNSTTVWDVRDMVPVGEPVPTAGLVKSDGAVALSRDGRLLAVQETGGDAQLWELPAMRRLGDAVPMGPAPLKRLYFDESGVERLVLVSAGGTVREIDLAPTPWRGGSAPGSPTG
ncbi:hypothetical protein FAF44_05735 [Nonomuraea sp. MG754425]|uniref:WD40 repeat domain-containing protein n=1 Tax=Nonomuraea sp. MG754425 TaxID=2570319 RepID=UPI001F224123|nr:hypothetical protein [Nonomuraea sp. MG754425]MCF6467905.1 hypothetical protein [Nonomuraea sp. MG754425]